MNKKILVFAAHPDDDVLGCGGTLAKHIANGWQVKVVFFTDGVSARETGEKDLSTRKIAAQSSLECLGVTEYSFGDFPDNQLDTVPLLELAKFVEGHLRSYSPTKVLTHFEGDLNIDHEKVSRAVVTACRPFEFPTIQTILMFEVPSSTDWRISTPGLKFSPNFFVDISDQLETKLKALEFYEKEMREFPHPRSIEAVKWSAILRGSTNGCHAAEAFVLARHLE